MRLPSQPPRSFLLLLRIIYVSTASKIVILFFRGRTQLEIHPGTFRFAILFASHRLKHGSPLSVPLISDNCRDFRCFGPEVKYFETVCSRVVRSSKKYIPSEFISVFRIFYFDDVHPVTFVFRESVNLVDSRSAGRLLRSVAETRTTVLIFRVRRKHENHRRVR